MVESNEGVMDGIPKIIIDVDTTSNKKDLESLMLEIVTDRDHPWVIVYDVNGKRLNPQMQRMEDALDFMAYIIRKYKKI